MVKEMLRACLLALGLVAMALGTTATAEAAGSGAPAQAQDAGAKKMSAGAMDQLKAQGATIVPHMTPPKALRAKMQGSADDPVCDGKRCLCKGPLNCDNFFKAANCAPEKCGTAPQDNEVYCICHKK